METIIDEKKKLPEVVIFTLPPSISLIGAHHLDSPKLTYLKAYESPLPLHQYLSTHAQSAQAILSSISIPVNDQLLDLLPAVRLVVTTSAGLNQIDFPACRRRGIAVANSGPIYSDDVADAAVGLLIDVSRRVSAANRYVRHGFWVTKGDYYPLAHKVGGKRVGIVGLGNIGKRVAKRLEAFGCTIMYNSRKKKPEFSYPFYQNICELAANSDALIICCGLTDKTRHMINREVLLALGKDGFVINVGRGAIIDEKEMVNCLINGEIGGAGLDVFENEPNVPKELREMDNVVMTPHNAVFTPESLQDVAKYVVANLEGFFENKPLLSEFTDE
ncbi:hypothetical protein ACFE04_026244 [Oxalis oulophora]